MDNKERYLNLLRSVKREGMDILIKYLESSTFFEDPASAIYHGNHVGGLCEHSLAVYDELVKLIGEENDTLKITALLHDICKVGTYKVDYRNVKNELGIWEKVPYYKAIGDDFPYGHGEKSVFIIQQFIQLNINEVMAIRWHMGSYEPKELWNDLGKAQELYPLCMYIHFADVIASRTKA